MKKIVTLKYLEAANYDDQPNFHVPRYQKGQGGSIFTDSTENDDEIIDKWKKKPKKSKKK